MKKSTIILLVVAALILIIGGYIWSVYNKLVSYNESIDGQWAQVETQYQRRLDLIPNLVEATKGVMKQEKDVFGQLADARSRYAGASTADKKAEAATQVESSLSRLLVVMENYPQLKSSETVQTLMSQLEGTENRVSVERKRYNDEVRDYNILVKRIPGSWVALMSGFATRDYFEAEAGASVAPKVNLTQ